MDLESDPLTKSLHRKCSLDHCYDLNVYRSFYKKLSNLFGSFLKLHMLCRVANSMLEIPGDLEVGLGEGRNFSNVLLP